MTFPDGLIDPGTPAVTYSYTVCSDGTIFGYIMLALGPVLPLILVVASVTSRFIVNDIIGWFMLLGGVFNIGINWTIGFFSDSPRPRYDEGCLAGWGNSMPSGEAQGVAYFLTLIIILYYFIGKLWESRFKVLCVFIFMFVNGYALLYTGSNTVAQVVLGFGLGAAFGVMWGSFLVLAVLPDIKYVEQAWVFKVMKSTHKEWKKRVQQMPVKNFIIGRYNNWRNKT